MRQTKHDSQKKSILFFAIIQYLFCVFFLVSCENDIQDVKLHESFENLPTETTKDARIVISDSALIRIILDAPQVDFYNDPDNTYTIWPKGINVKFYNKNMEVKSSINANYAIRYSQQKRTEAKGDVVVVNTKGEQLNTEYLVWDEEKKLITTDKFVRITTPTEIITGTGLKAKEDFSSYVINNISGSIELETDSI